MSSEEIRDSCGGMEFWLREIAAQIAELNENIRLLVPKPVCPRCHGKGWICIHCDKSLTECQCPDDGSRNPGSCDRCGMTGVISQAAADLYEAEDESIEEQKLEFEQRLSAPVSDPLRFTRCSECASEMPRPDCVPIGEPSICDGCIPF